MRPINEIIVHCTATRPEWMADKPTAAKVAEIDAWHRQRGWSQVGYHYLIDRDGTVAAGRPVEKVGAHVKGHNKGTIGVSLIGGHGSAETDDFADHYTPEQDAALRKLLASLKAAHGITKISAHHDYAAKACPGFDLKRWLGEPAKPVRTSAVQSTTVQASAVQIASGAGGAVAAVGALDGAAQLIAIGGCVLVVLLALWIMRERLKAWADGRR
jgi:hypothetical protein